MTQDHSSQKLATAQSGPVITAPLSYLLPLSAVTRWASGAATALPTCSPWLLLCVNLSDILPSDWYVAGVFLLPVQLPAAPLSQALVLCWWTWSSVDSYAQMCAAAHAATPPQPTTPSETSASTYMCPDHPACHLSSHSTGRQQRQQQQHGRYQHYRQGGKASRQAQQSSSLAVGQGRAHAQGRPLLLLLQQPSGWGSVPHWPLLGLMQQI